MTHEQMYEKLRQNPFHLDDGQLSWVQETFASMDQKAKVGQLFCLAARDAEERMVTGAFDVCEPAGFMFRSMPLASHLHFTEMLNKREGIPMLIAGDVERGGFPMIKDRGTQMGTPMEIAASHDLEYARRLGKVCGAELAAIGGNWAFSPIIDIDMNYRNPITNVRTFGSDPALVRDMSREFVKAVQQEGCAASIKHFPGDGCDDRDQHIAITINDLDCETWMNTYGSVYKACIDAGAKTVMVGHIMQPAWSRKLRPHISDAELLPASLSPELMGDLLRGELGFNGLIVTDASTMVGFTSAMPRRHSVPGAIAAGADILLFPKNLKEDFGFMLQGVKDGVISQERLDEAVLRVLGLKASLRIYERRETPSVEAASAVIGCEEHSRWAKEAAERGITLVKEQPGVLPISPEKYPRLLVYPIYKQTDGPFYSADSPCREMIEKLREVGFDITVFEPRMGVEGLYQPTSDFVKQYDLMLYIAYVPTVSNQTVTRIDWASPIGANCPIYIHDVPTVFISLENPYHLQDAPRVKTYINAYCSSPQTIDAVIEKLLGKSPFMGTSPVDAFCGRWDTHL